MTCLLPVKAVPNATRSEVAGWLGEAVKIKLRAPPVDGKANEALIKFLAERLSLPQRAIALERGSISRHKMIRIVGLSLEDVRRRLGTKC